MRKWMFVLGGCLWSLCSPTYGEPSKYEVDPVHSSVDFEIGHMGISEITGRFRSFSGVLELDPNSISELTLSATLEVSSIDTANRDRDDHLQQDDYFHSEKYPYITFVSKKVEKVDEGDEGKYLITGDFNMHGVTREVVMEFEYGGAAKNHKGQDIIGFDLEGELNRIDFGVGNEHRLDNGKLSLGVEVEFEIHAEAIKQE